MNGFSTKNRRRTEHERRLSRCVHLRTGCVPAAGLASGERWKSKHQLNSEVLRVHRSLDAARASRGATGPSFVSVALRFFVLNPLPSSTFRADRSPASSSPSADRVQSIDDVIPDGIGEPRNRPAYPDAGSLSMGASVEYSSFTHSSAGISSNSMSIGRSSALKAALTSSRQVSTRPVQCCKGRERWFLDQVQESSRPRL